MTRYVALLRGIGPVTHAKMPLRVLVERLGGDALNVGNTGNIVFTSDAGAAEARATAARAVQSFGIASEVFIRTRRQIQMLIGLSPFPEAQEQWPSALGVCFFHKAPDWPAAYRDYRGPERLMMFSNHLIVDYGGRITGSNLMIEKATGARMTQRNWSSVLRIADKLGL
jgi:uncharacterized protein (DUF1697 family)